jgi:hypothetical protein
MNDPGENWSYAKLSPEIRQIVIPAKAGIQSFQDLLVNGLFKVSHFRS